MNNVKRSVPGLRDAMFDVLDQLRSGDITARAARVQMEAAKTICLTVACERTELHVIQQQIELDQKIQQVEDRRHLIEYVQ